GLDAVLPGPDVTGAIRAAVAEIDFYQTVMEGMLGFLLFAGALHVNLNDLHGQRWPIALMATIGVTLSTVIIGLGFWWLTGVPLLVALVFGALISPTEPVAVLGILKTVSVPKSLETKIAGESLFNDGVGVVVCLVMVALAFPKAGAPPMDAMAVVELLLVEAVGGAVLGLATGWIAFRMIRLVDEYNLEVIITLALAMGAYALAGALHVSGPIAVVVAGLLIGNHGVRLGMSARSAEHVRTFWHLIDEILNAALFLLIGVEVFALSFGAREALIALVTIPLVLVARAAAVGLPIGLLRWAQPFTPGGAPVLIWGGLRGGISVALVLSLPDGPDKPLLLAATYAVVIFSIVVQGLTVRRVIQRFIGP
ncbi:MAG: sodium:proton antiporter, partial [Pseudomonadota bacterium]|nr:sodium:proton antiporter [Pseudomonadota bacterium]